MLERMEFLNPLLAVFGRKIIRSYMGRWSIGGDGKLHRRLIQMGWRVAPRTDWEGLSDKATELERFMAANRRKA